MTLDLFGNEYNDELGTDVQIFESAEFGSVRVVVKDGEPWFVAVDVCECLGIGNSRQAVSYLDKDEKGVINSDTLGGRQDLAIVSEAGLYSLVLRSRKPEAKAFKRWITHEVLPSIRKTGGYSVHPAVQEALDRFNVPKDYLSALKQLVVIEEQRQELASQVTEMKPKASYYDALMTAGNTYSTTQLAKPYGTSAQAFNERLHEMGIQFKQGKQWHLYAEHQGKGYTKSVTECLENGRWVTYTRWTEEGRAFVYYELAKLGVYPNGDPRLS